MLYRLTVPNTINRKKSPPLKEIFFLNCHYTPVYQTNKIEYFFSLVFPPRTHPHFFRSSVYWIAGFEWSHRGSLWPKHRFELKEQQRIYKEQGTLWLWRGLVHIHLNRGHTDRHAMPTKPWPMPMYPDSMHIYGGYGHSETCCIYPEPRCGHSDSGLDHRADQSVHPELRLMPATKKKKGHYSTIMTFFQSEKT